MSPIKRGPSKPNVEYLCFETRKTRLKPPFGRYLAMAAGLLLGVSTIQADVTFSDLVAERNLAPTSLSLQSFPGADDQVNRFNGALRYSIPIGQSFPLSTDFDYQLSLEYTSSVWGFDTDSSGVAAEPQTHFNAGIGWQLSWGRLLPPASTHNPSNFWVYQSPGGRVSRFYSTLNDGDAAEQNVFYSRDGRFLRLRTGLNAASVDFPNGQTRDFTLQGTAWRLASWSDASGNSVGIDYSTPGRQVITDSHGRVHRVFLIPDPAGHYSELIDRIELAAWNGTVATYQLAYDTVIVSRPSQDSSSSTAATVSLPVLSAVTRPDGTYFSVDYDTGTGDESGRLSSLRLPTGGTISYLYDTIALPFYTGAEHTADVTGVSRRAMVDHQGLELGAWDLQWQMDIPRQQGSVDQPRELTTSVIYPEGHRRDFYFSVYVSGNSANNQNPASLFSTKNYGLPMTANGKSGAFFPSTTIVAADGQALRSTQLRYTTAPCDGCYDVNPRLDRLRTIYHDDNHWTETTTFTQWTGLGQFGRIARFDSSFSVPYQVTEVDYATAPPASTSPWILGLFSERSESYGSETSVEHFCHDSQTGRLLRRRRLAGATAAAGDVVEVYGYDSAGHATSTHYFGGDVQAVGTTSDLCTLSLPAAESYAAYRSYSYGVVDEKGWLAADGSVFITTYAATIDANTGRVNSSHQGDDLTWTYAYDSLGRLVSATPPAGHGGERVNTYTAAADPPAGPTTSNDPYAYTSREVRETDGSVLSSTITRFDDFGRVLSQSRQTPAGWATTIYSRDAHGRVSAVTDPAGRITQWDGRDEFGRPLRKVPPEGAQHERILTYAGKGFSTETFNIGKQWDAATSSVVEIDRTVSQRKDRLGRLIEKTITDADGQSRTETWSYSRRGHGTAGSISDGTTTHTWTSADPVDGRGFVATDAYGDPITGYDALGKLTEDDFGQGTLVRLYDRAGRLVEEREGSAAGPLWVKNVYGTANDGNDLKKNKLIQSIRVNRDVPHMPDGYVQVQDNYSYEGDGGRVSSRVTAVIAGFNAALPLFSFDSTAGYDGLGQTVELAFPDCRVDLGNPAVSCERLPERTLEFDYQYGYLTALDSTVSGVGESWIEQIDYATDGFVTRRVFADGFIETSTPDLSGGGRVERLTIEHPGLGTFYDSGTAVYDGNGKLVQLGADRHISDFAYALDLFYPPADAGIPQTVVQSSLKDIYGLKKRRFYKVPYRYGTLGSADGEEDVWEIYIYGPGHRTLWTREFNDYDAYNYGYSKDRWQLTDLLGRRVRERQGLTNYVGSQPRFDDATVESVGLAAHQESADTIFLDGKILGTSDNRFSTPQRTFIHRDIRGRTLAVTNQDGEVEHHVTILY